MGRSPGRAPVPVRRALTARVPVTVVGGYLGAGKTTLVNHLLRNAGGLRIAVLVNDFGALPIDADLIEAQGDDLISIAGGCVCCAYGNDLMAALMALPQRALPPQHVLVETSGVALPGAVARSIKLIAGFDIDSVAVLADAETVRARAADRYMGDTIERQLAEADLVLLNKTDLVSPEQLEELRTWLRHESPGARLIEAVRAQVPPELLFGRGQTRSPRPAAGMFAAGAIRPMDDAATRYESASFTEERPVDVRSLADELARPELGLIRAKGVLRDLDGSLKALHLVGARREVTPYALARDAHQGLACIGLAGRIDRAAIERALARAAAAADATVAPTGAVIPG